MEGNLHYLPCGIFSLEHQSCTARAITKTSCLANIKLGWLTAFVGAAEEGWMSYLLYVCRSRKCKLDHVMFSVFVDLFGQ
jgi:hypothetical protein